MSRTCEVCAGLVPSKRPQGVGAKRLRRLLFERRVVLLCDAHANLVRNAAAETAREVRETFVESDGRRSPLDRRAPLDRRLFPPRPEGRRARGRRTTDIG